MLEHGGARGRMVRLSRVADTILSRYDYPPAVARMLGELLLVASMLSANLKQDGILTIQLRGDGPVTLAVVDAAMGGTLRGYADIAPDTRDQFRERMTPAEIMGDKAYLAITVDPGEGMQRYQGIVSLEGETITDALLEYFTRSQQVAVFLRLAVEKDADGQWQAGGLMMERLADDGGAQVHDLAAYDEHWRTAMALVHTVKSTELLDPLLVSDALLYQLFHEDGVWVYAPHLLHAGCRCSREKIHALLTGMSLDDRIEMLVDGAVEVHCQFCNTHQRFSPQEIGVSLN